MQLQRSFDCLQAPVEHDVPFSEVTHNSQQAFTLLTEHAVRSHRQILAGQTVKNIKTQPTMWEEKVFVPGLKHLPTTSASNRSCGCP